MPHLTFPLRHPPVFLHFIKTPHHLTSLHKDLTSLFYLVSNGKRNSTDNMKANPSSNGRVQPGISIRMGPVQVMDIDKPQANGHANGKRKSRGSAGQSYKDMSSSDDDAPLVCQ